MSLEIMTDPRIRSVEWKDLMHLNKLEVFREVTIYLPWLIMGMGLGYVASQTHWLWYAPALGASFMFYLTGLRQVHNAFHYAIGIPRLATEWSMVILSVLMLGSMHVVQFNHLRHHKHCMDDEDVEAMSAKMSGWRALALGPYFPYMLHKTALEKAAPRELRWIYLELALNVVFIYGVFFVFNLDFLKFHVIAMAIGQCLSGFFAVWTVHHDCDRSHYIARTQRNPIKNFISYNMFYHVEHHLYPKVPTCHLPILAKRLDDAAPELCSKVVF